MKKIAVVLSGCGFKDGSEITEAVSTLIALSEFGAKYQCFAPNIQISSSPYFENHGAGETRSVLNESARIARGEIKDLRELKSKDFDAVVFPGGYGAAKNLCNFASLGAGCEVHPEVERVILDFHKSSLPIGAICIAPALVARVLGKKHQITVTVGNDKETIAEILKTGAQHAICQVDDYISDRDHKILTTPAYMYEAQPFEIFKGIRLMLKELVEMA